MIKYLQHTPLPRWLDYLRTEYPIQDNFEFFLGLNIVLFIFCWLLGTIRDWDLPNKLSVRNLKEKGFRFAVKYIPQARNKFNQQINKIPSSIQSTFPPEYRSALRKIPKKSINLNVGNKSETEALKGFLSGSRYPVKDHSEYVAELSSKFIYSNPLHTAIHPYVRQMECEVIRMCAKMLNYTDNGQAVGVLLSGGTESILMAILACREYGRSKGITAPNLLICETGHVAGIKACSYFDIQIRVVKYDKNYEMSLSDIKSKMDKNTVCVYTSYPNFPYGGVDPVDTIASYCKKRDVPVHLDMCLGGFVVPFLKGKDGKPLFTVPDGVTSISLDPHKYGLSGKGASVLLYNTQKMRNHQFFAISTWPGGLYGTPGISGSRSGVSVAAAWISMMKMGAKGYRQTAERVQKAVLKLASSLRQSGFKIFGDPQICTIGFVHPLIPTNSIQVLMKKRGWGLSVMQRPLSFHFSFTPLNSLKVDQLIKDLREVSAEILKKNEPLKPNDVIELYGACAQIPDTMAKNTLLGIVLDTYIDI